MPTLTPNQERLLRKNQAAAAKIEAKLRHFEALGELVYRYRLSQRDTGKNSQMVRHEIVAKMDAELRALGFEL